VLDGGDRLPADVLSSLQRLAHDRELDLCDGGRLSMHAPKAPESPKAPAAAAASVESCSVGSGAAGDVGVRPLRANFRMCMLATPPLPGKASWLTPEVATLFRVHTLPPLTDADAASLLAARCPAVPPGALAKLLTFNDALVHPHGRHASGGGGARGDRAPGHANGEVSGHGGGGGGGGLSVRQLLRLARRLEAFPATAEEDLPGLLGSALLRPFLPAAQQLAVDAALKSAGLGSSSSLPSSLPSSSSSAAAAAASDATAAGHAIEGADAATGGGGTLRIGAASAPRRSATRPEMVPAPLFFANACHDACMGQMLASHAAGEKALLLIGNQGVGKNKVADRLLQLLGAERECVWLRASASLSMS